MIEQLTSLAYEANLPGLLAVAISALAGLMFHVWATGDSE